jgi:hypothetical protein
MEPRGLAILTAGLSVIIKATPTRGVKRISESNVKHTSRSVIYYMASSHYGASLSATPKRPVSEPHGAIKQDTYEDTCQIICLPDS